jgi:cyanophycinase
MHPLALALCLLVPLQEKGRLVVAGGGATTAEITKRTLDLAGGAEASVLVIPQASESSDGKASAEMWKTAGAKETAILDLADPKKAVAQVDKATLIWIPGGDQARLMEKLAATGVPEAIRKRFDAGAVVGGTSAGAAVMSKTMIAGPGEAKGLQKGAVRFADGLGLWPEVLVDQHFVARDRFARLYSAVLEKPSLVGIGIDESTAVVVKGSSIEVIGKSSVVVIDARKAKIAIKDGEPPSATGVATHILKPGDTFDLK